MNLFAPLYEKCNTGTNAAKYAVLSDFPSLIDIEPSGLCNMRCVFCPTGVGALKRDQGFMKAATFEKIAVECAEHGTAIRMIGWGEPLLNPAIVWFVRRASQLGVLTHINTNASKLSRALAAQLVQAGLSSIKVSFQGADRASYREMRQ